MPAGHAEFGERVRTDFAGPTKYLQLAVLGLGGVALLMWPGPVQWELCVALGALLTGGLASVQWAYYKKHM